MSYIISGKNDKFTNLLLKANKELYCSELECYEKGNKHTEYIIFGGGDEGKKTYKILKACHKKVVGGVIITEDYGEKI